MNSIINFISDNETIVMSVLFIIVIILTGTVFIIDYINNRKKKNEIKELFIDHKSDINKTFKETLEESNPLDDTTIIEDDIIDVNEDDPFVIKYVEEDEELEKTKAQLELKNLKEELLKAELKEKEKLVKIEEPLETKENIIDLFENQQEENAIISLEQFNEVSDKVYDNNEITQYKDEGNEPISIQELEDLYKNTTTEIKPQNKLEPNIKINETPKVPIVSENDREVQKFKNSPIISPVFGVDKGENLSTIVLENTSNYDRLSEEIRKTNEFLNELKEFRKNL